MDAQVTTIEQSAGNPLIGELRQALQRAIVGEGKLPDGLLALEGMSGKKYRLLINNLIGSVGNPAYLEIGSWAGSTLCSAIYGNRVRATAIDNWSQFGGPCRQFYTNLAKFKSSDARVSFLEEDFRNVNFSALGKFNVYLFDGPHTFEDHVEGVTIAQPALEDQFILIVDDWNWQHVRDGTARAIRECNLTLDFTVEIRSSLDNSQPAARGQRSDWHNGYFIAAVSKSPTATGT